MDRKTLIDEITAFLFKYKIIDKSVKVNTVKQGIEQNLDECAFVERLLYIIYKTSRVQNKLSDEKITNLLVELEKVRVTLEDK